MKKKLDQKALDELSFMRDWNWVIVDFLVKNENEEVFKELFKELHQIISITFDKKDLRGMRMIYNDNNEMARGLSQDKQSELNQILKEKFGFSLERAHDLNLAKINQILQRGYLKNDDEFRLLLSHTDEIYADSSKKKEVETLENLMADYESSKAANKRNRG